MKTAAIIAEYNPLHNGHIYHLDQTRTQSGADYVVVIMSGNFVQRGEPACADKMTRAEWALKAGADIVLELPSIYSVGNAERFALGAIRTLESTGVIDFLSFGCEEPDLRILYSLADLLASPSDAFINCMHANLEKGLSFPRAQSEALRAIGIDPKMTESLSNPNNILAVEYLKALRLNRSGIRPLAIMRNDDGYHSESIGSFYSSASAIRNAFRKKEIEAALPSMPSYVGGTFMFNEGYPIFPEDFSSMLMYALRKMTAGQIREIPDVGEGIENLIIKEAIRCRSISELFDAVKSKRYTMARIKRIVLCAALGISMDHIRASMHGSDGLYLRVLGFRSESEQLLSEIARKRTAPLILKKEDERECSDIVRSNLAIDSLSTDLMRYATGIDIRRDHTAPIVI